MTIRTQRRGMRLIVALAVTAASLALPSLAFADIVTLGSDLSAPANVAETHGADTAFWAPTVGGRDNAVPADGQILELRLKGTALPSTQPGARPPLVQMHFQSLRPQPDGSVTVILSTNPFDIPAAGDPNQISHYVPDGYLCVKRGDYFDFNDEGGFDPPFYPNGVPYQVFSSVSGETTLQYTKDNGTNIGTNFTGTPTNGEELLLQAVLGTGYDASPICGGLKGQEFHGLQIATQKLIVRKGLVRVRALCPGTSRQACTGTLTLTGTRGSAANQVLGRASFSVPSTATSNVHVTLNALGSRLLRKAKSRVLPAVARAEAQDGLGRKMTTSGKLALVYIPSYRHRHHR